MQSFGLLASVWGLASAGSLAENSRVSTYASSATASTIYSSDYAADKVVGEPDGSKWSPGKDGRSLSVYVDTLEFTIPEAAHLAGITIMVERT